MSRAATVIYRLCVLAALGFIAWSSWRIMEYTRLICHDGVNVTGGTLDIDSQPVQVEIVR